MRKLAWALLLSTLQATLIPDLAAQDETLARSIVVLVPATRDRSQDAMLAALVDELSASDQFAAPSIIEIPKFAREDRARSRQVRSLRQRSLSNDVVVCIGSPALYPFLGTNSELPDSVALFSLGVLGIAHAAKTGKLQHLPNLHRLRGVVCADITMRMAICFIEQIRSGAGPYGAIVSEGLPDNLVDEAKALALRLGTRLDVERVKDSSQLETAAKKLIGKGMRTFIKVPDSFGIADRKAAKVVSRIRLKMVRRGIAIMGLGPRDKDGAFGFELDYAQSARDLAMMILSAKTSAGQPIDIRTATRVIPYVRSSKHLDLRPNWARTLTIPEDH